ncbi:hypothetical protein GCM10012275_38590 [Longimycelium tulufanense]|uniref:Uncharacterized protein n=1 Tax=Longimycelium tulufanense TaxID=907463 RepID=A0A8J3CA73_9PSEU|nr:hypothetical protein [Longimycelium tulufanense]GGM64306.1 hypothetical protein GCM10012275_38590 [Longimycelium tulufanense]
MTDRDDTSTTQAEVADELLARAAEWQLGPTALDVTALARVVDEIASRRAADVLLAEGARLMARSVLHGVSPERGPE